MMLGTLHCMRRTWRMVKQRDACNFCSMPSTGTCNKTHLIWRTMAASLSCWESQSKTPSSCISFQMAPCPPGFSRGARPSGTSHLPSSALMRGTNGCLNNLHMCVAYWAPDWAVCSKCVMCRAHCDVHELCPLKVSCQSAA